MACGIFIIAVDEFLSCWGAQAQLPRGMWDLIHQPGIEPNFPASEGGFLTTGPSEKSLELFIFFEVKIKIFLKILYIFLRGD